MPLYMDHHKIEGLTAEAVAEAHQKDLETQDKHGAKALKYWFNEENGDVFCLFDARRTPRPRRPSTARRTG
jgi:hypothetical protein